MRRPKPSVLAYAIAASALLITLLLGAFAAYSHAAEKKELREELGARASLMADQLALSLETPVWNLDREQVAKIVETALRDSELSGVALRYNDVAHSALFRGKDPEGRLFDASGEEFPGADIVERRVIGRQGQNLGSLALLFNGRALDRKLGQALAARLTATLSLEAGLLLGLWALLWFRVLKPWKLENDARVEAARREAEAQMLRLERLAAIGQTAAGLSHEVRNPLAVISTCAQFVKMQLGASHSLHTDLDSILRQTERLKDLVNDVLERSRSAELKLSLAGADELLQSALKAAQLRYGLASERVDLALDLAAAPRLKVDVAQIERVLVNLILNAFQAMPSGGALTLSARAEGAWALIEICDNGPGIPEDKMEKIFEPFYTTKETGSGLGLWICKGIVEQHQGSLEASNLRPRGARLSLRLPLEAGS